MRLYNTMSRSVEELKPLQEGAVKIYTCGLTVYSQPHIGNWLGYVYWDVLVRTLEAEGFKVERTQNITDVGHLTSDDDNGEDKMEKGARSEGVTAWDIANKYSAIADHEAYELLALIRPTSLTRATDMIEQQIQFAEILDQKGYLYEILGDGMYFDTSKLSDYGKLARLDIAGLEAGARVSVEGKRNITDFAVWKFSPANAKRDMEWDSPWGIGFPGWHLECSVIARETLGDRIDIHTGGIDHIPVHHTNEIAQTESVTEKPFSQLWVHNNHVKVDGQKMAKSLGTIYTLEDIIEKGYSLDDFKVFAFGKHYRTEGNFTWDNLEAAANRRKNWQEAAALRWQEDKLPAKQTDYRGDMFEDKILQSLSNDLATNDALQVIDEACDQIQKGNVCPACCDAIFASIYSLLGIQLDVNDISDEQKMRIKSREDARNAKDWATSDTIRDELQSQGIFLNDTANGTLWYRA
ncbi:MAG: cysteinyl-tRNA synthetase [Patescibacteria group bacterium]|nr:cysteine--tRNA ligase [Candidatus Saccharibacteria bacterium]MDQ5963631.1 cysteinyl-tRNA synthetase [Patescibacteria group bacterium]